MTRQNDQTMNLLKMLFSCVQQMFCSGNNNNNNNQQQNQQQGQQQYPGGGGQQQQGGAWGNQQQQQQHSSYPPQQHQPQPHQQPYKPSSAGQYGQVTGPYNPGGQDPNMVNQSNAKYMEMRDRARKEGDSMRDCFEKSKQAYSRGDGGAAHQLSEEGKSHQRRKQQIDQEARDWIYYQNNTDSPPGTIDLHGLYVKEAVEKSETEIQNAQQRGDHEIKFIVGKGNHSASHVSKIKPAIEGLMDKYNLDARLDPHNSGVLIVNLQGGGGGASRGRELGNELEKKNGDCVVM
ncbi:hypothetical protein BDY24DRAFT_382620 [Mrakia frigida]|uniref:Smr domain-containing protein n=1 Tax=Mrakia frigida TaxID=29902 RepID=UPI003FCC25DA